MSVSPTSFFDSSDTALQRALKERVNAHFEKTGRSRHATVGMVLKTSFFLGALVGLWGVLVSGALPALAAVPVCLALGFVFACIGFNVGHDAIHGAYSEKRWVNTLLSHSFDLMGASSYTWSRAHNFVHHTYTNIPGVDGDLEPGPYMLFKQEPNPSRWYRLQWLYAPFFYSFTSLMWVFKKDYVQVLSPDPETGKRHAPKEVLKVFAWKAVHLGVFIGAPLLVGAYAWWQVLLGYWLMQAVTGLTLATVFQLAHVVEGVEFPTQGAPRRSWAAHQLNTTANFAPTNRLVAFLCGGLNRQVEHHLFARICHVHYPELSAIVREVAREHGVPYHEHSGFFAALGSHIRTLHRFGRAPAPAVPATPVAVATVG